ncbi:MAG: hypothetical protein K2X97_02680 [Mycobacteriaceae bacterium]|nr:hypothetical protein [Mycobacteriaceae bacterium]
MIDRFPIDASAMTAVLASALATRIAWLRPYDVTGAAELRSSWSTRVAEALSGADGYFTDVAGLGVVGVHTAVGVRLFAGDVGDRPPRRIVGGGTCGSSRHRVATRHRVESAAGETRRPSARGRSILDDHRGLPTWWRSGAGGVAGVVGVVEP